ncbi:putative cullin [Helianthus anomalus]
MMFEIQLSCYPICANFVELRCLIMFFRCCIGCLCVSDEAERSLILKLKIECGYQFTSRFERMFIDMKISEDTMKHVLTTGSWSIKSTATCKLPSEIQTVYDEFTSYYLGTYSGRGPTWQTNMGSFDIKATFGTGQEHELHVSTYQMCVLMLFNSVDRLS